MNANKPARLGYRKIVYDEGNGPRAIRGEAVLLADFVKVTTNKGCLFLNIKHVIAIKRVCEGGVND